MHAMSPEGKEEPYRAIGCLDNSPNCDNQLPISQKVALKVQKTDKKDFRLIIETLGNQ